jgi:hypothetical protein
MLILQTAFAVSSALLESEQRFSRRPGPDKANSSAERLGDVKLPTELDAVSIGSGTGEIGAIHDGVAVGTQSTSDGGVCIDVIWQK